MYFFYRKLYSIILQKERNLVNKYLNLIHSISIGKAGICSSVSDSYKILTGVPINIVESFKLPKEMAELIAFFMPNIRRSSNAKGN